jgi:hypothetical protein
VLDRPPDSQCCFRPSGDIPMGSGNSQNVNNIVNHRAESS